MSSAIGYRDQFFNVTNQRFENLIEFALEVGSQIADSDQQKLYVESLRDKAKNTYYRGYDLSIETEWPSRDERKFWSKVLFDVAHLIYQRKLGGQDAQFWQYSAIGEAYLFARLISRSVRDEEPGWWPTTLASEEATAFHKLNVRL